MITKPMLRMKDSIATRKHQLYVCAKVTARAVSNQFNGYMGKRGHSGRIKVDHNAGSLQMEVPLTRLVALGLAQFRSSSTHKTPPPAPPHPRYHICYWSRGHAFYTRTAVH
jgi:hypothetical protein